MSPVHLKIGLRDVVGGMRTPKVAADKKRSGALGIPADDIYCLVCKVGWDRSRLGAFLQTRIVSVSGGISALLKKVEPANSLFFQIVNIVRMLRRITVSGVIDWSGIIPVMLGFVFLAADVPLAHMGAVPAPSLKDFAEKTQIG
jgi:hypothetical protein